MPEQQRAKQGVLLAIAAYTMWGIAPIYFKALGGIPPLEILSHRIVWSVLLLAVLLHFGQGWANVKQVISQKKRTFLLLCSATLVAVNWLIFIWAVNSDMMLEASLGYYINPIINVILGMLFLQERLRKLQWVAVALAATGVLIELIAFGSIPYVSFALAISFGFYGLLRKKINADAQTGLFIETLFLAPIAAVYLLSIDTPTSSMWSNSLNLNLLLIAAGIVTTAPLLCFTGAATRLKLSTLGFFQYIGPSLMFLLAVTVYQEPLTEAKVITFGFIWLALVLFSVDGIQNHKRKPIPNA